jgi:hypothetical protein
MDNQNKNVFSNFKILGLGILSLLALIIDWTLINTALYTDKTLLFWIWPAATTIVAIALLTLFSAINSTKTYAIALGVMSMAAYVIIFPKDPFVWVGGLVFLALLFWFELRIRGEEKARVDFSIRRVTESGVNVIIYAFLILLALNIYHNTSEDFKSNPDGFYQALGHSAAKSARYISGGEGSGFDLNQSLDQYLEGETRRQVPNYDTIPQDFRDQYLEETKQEFFRQFNLQIPGDQPLAEVIATFAVNRVRESAEKFSALLPLIFTLIIFALLRTFSFVLRLLSLMFTWLIFKILYKIKFFRLSKAMIEVEKLEI